MAGNQADSQNDDPYQQEDRDNRAGYEDLPQHELGADRFDRCITEREREISPR
jgi:hypothetical protein